MLFTVHNKASLKREKARKFGPELPCLRSHRERSKHSLVAYWSPSRTCQIKIQPTECSEQANQLINLFLVDLFLVSCSLLLAPCSLLLVPCYLFLVPCSFYVYILHGPLRGRRYPRIYKRLGEFIRGVEKR